MNVVDPLEMRKRSWATMIGVPAELSNRSSMAATERSEWRRPTRPSEPHRSNVFDRDDKTQVVDVVTTR